MTPGQFDDFIESVDRAADAIDRRLDRSAERSWRETDATVNGTFAAFMGVAALMQRLPFPNYFGGQNGRDSGKAG